MAHAPCDYLVLLADGRNLSYAEYGASDGIPVLFLHGFPGSRLDAVLIDEPARVAGVRIIAPERPGMGKSTPRPGFSLLNWADDLYELCQRLNLSSVHVLGVSGGGPYALACAWRMPQSIQRVGLICPLGPAYIPGLLTGMNGLGASMLRLAAAAPGVARWALRTQGFIVARNRRRLVRGMRLFMPPKDQAILDNPAVLDAMVAYTGAALAQGTVGLWQDLHNYSHDWSFALEQIDAPILLWQGERDNIVPPGMARYLAAWLPHARTVFWPEDGHYAALFTHYPEILAELLA